MPLVNKYLRSVSKYKLLCQALNWSRLKDLVATSREMILYNIMEAGSHEKDR